MIPKGLCQCGCGQRTKISPQNQTVGGYVRGEPRRFLSGHHSRLPEYAHVVQAARQAAAAIPRPALTEAFWSKVQKGDGCWLWTAAQDTHGYGAFRRPGTTGAATKAHRMAWELSYGPILPGFHVLHRCDNPPCVRPSHLFLGDPAVNMRDASRKGRMRKTAATRQLMHEIMAGRAPSPKATAAFKRAVRQRAIERHQGHDAFVSQGKFYCRTCRNARQQQYRKVSTS